MSILRSSKDKKFNGNTDNRNSDRKRTPSSRKQREEDYGLGMYKVGNIQKKLPNRDLLEEFPGVTHDVLASYVSKRKRGMPMDQVQTDLIQTYGLSNYSRFMKILKSEGLGDFKTTGKTGKYLREIIEESTQYPKDK